jgi:copper transport protein
MVDIRGRRVPSAWRAVAVLAGSAVGLLAAVLPAVPAFAHAVLLRTDPPADTVLEAAPAEVVLTFSEPVRPVAGKVRVTRPDGQRGDADTSTVDHSTLRIPMRAGGPEGSYVVSYRVISEDGHPVGGAFIFSVGASSAPPAIHETSSGADPFVVAALAGARMLGHVGLALLIGTVLVLVVLWPRRLPRRGPAQLAVTGMVLLAAGTVAELYLQAPYTAGTSVLGATTTGMSEVLTSRYGLVHLARLGVLLIVAVLLRPLLARSEPESEPVTEGARGGRLRPARAASLLVLTVAGLATWPLSGHSGSSSTPVVATVVDVAHLAAMSVWLGGLVVLLGYLIRQADDRELDVALPVWSRWGTWAVAVLVLAGTVQAAVQIGTFDALATTWYGRLVLIKVGLLTVILLAAAYARRLAHRTVVPDTAGRTDTAGVRRARLRRTVVVELTVLVMILGVTSVLVRTAPTTIAGSVAEQRDLGPYTATLTSTLYVLEVTIDPARPGDNMVHLLVHTSTGSPVSVVEWGGSVALPAQDIEPIALSVRPVTASHAVAEVRLPAAGSWEFRFNLRVSDVDQATVVATVPIGR